MSRHVLSPIAVLWMALVPLACRDGGPGGEGSPSPRDALLARADSLELDTEYVKSAQDVVKIGDTVRVKVLSIDDQGRIKLSRKAAVLEESAAARSN